MSAKKTGFDTKNIPQGFTIVELLIVIVVIGILAAITIVAYNGIQARATDARMMSGVSQLEKAILLWHAKTGQQPRGGWGSTVVVANGSCADGGGGWVAAGTYTCALEDALVSEQTLPAGFMRKLPVNKAYGGSSDGVLSVMLYPCSGTNRYALYWHLLSPSATDTSNLAAVEASGCPASPRTTYGMKAAKILTF